MSGLSCGMWDLLLWPMDSLVVRGLSCSTVCGTLLPCNLIRERVYGWIKAQGLTNDIVAKRMGISSRTFQRRMEKPGEMSLEEMRKLLNRTLHFPVSLPSLCTLVCEAILAPLSVSPALWELRPMFSQLWVSDIPTQLSAKNAQ